MDVYPIMLRLSGRRAAVVGGGPIALRKARALQSAGAVVRLISRDPPADADLTGLDVVGGDYRPEHLEGASLVFACTDDAELNRRIARDARRIGALANCVDQPDDCDFFSSAVVAEGPVVIAVGTSGTAPGLAKRLGEAIGRELPPRIGDFAAALGAMRPTIKDAVRDARRRGRIMTHLTSPAAYEMFLTEGQAGLSRMLDALLD